MRRIAAGVSVVSCVFLFATATGAEERSCPSCGGAQREMPSLPGPPASMPSMQGGIVPPASLGALSGRIKQLPGRRGMRRPSRSMGGLSRGFGASVPKIPKPPKEIEEFLKGGTAKRGAAGPKGLEKMMRKSAEANRQGSSILLEAERRANKDRARQPQGVEAILRGAEKGGGR